MNIFDSIKVRFASGVFLLIAIITVSLSVLSYEYEKKAIRGRVYAQLNATADLKKELLVSYLKERINDLKILAASGYIRTDIFSLSDKNRSSIQKKEKYKYIRQHLTSFKNIPDDYISLDIADFNGNIIVSTEGAPLIPEYNHEHIKTVINKNFDVIKGGVIAVTYDPLNAGVKHLDLIAGVRDKDGNVRAAIISNLGLENTIFPMFSDYTGLGLTGETVLVKLSGDRMVHINPERHPHERGAMGVKHISEHFKLGMYAASGNEGIAEGIDYRGNRVIGAYRYVPLLKWGIVTKIDADEVFREIIELRKKILVLGLLILGIMLAVTYIIVNKLTAPIIRLTQKTRALASGDYSVRIESERKDEIGDLERCFNDTMSALNYSREEIKSKQKELEEINYELEAKVFERTKKLSDALEDVKRSKIEWAHAMDSVEDAVYLVDLSDKVMRANRSFYELTGLTEEQTIGRDITRLMHPQGEPVPCPVCRARRTRKDSRITMEADHPDNPVRRPIEVIVKMIRKESGEPIAVLMAIKDLSQIRHDEEEKSKLHAMLSQSQKMESIGTLAGGIAHDFNNILTAIIGYGNLLQMKLKEDDPLRFYVEQMLASSEKAANLTQSLLAFSRKQLINPKPVNLNEVIKKVEKMLLRLIGEDIEFRTIFSEEDLTVFADSGQIEQALMNLCTNARDAMPQGGCLTIETAFVEIGKEYEGSHYYGKPGYYTLLSVTDTGMGMDENTRENIFEPFFTTKESGKGTGLGLAMVYGIIKQHNGSIHCFSEPGKGATFKIYLPLHISECVMQSAELNPKSEIQNLQAIAGGTETVLLAEDNADVRKLAQRVLEECGYRVIEAVDGEDAINKFIESKDKIQLLVLDVVMPRKNGMEVYKEIQKSKPDIKAFFMSGYTADVIHKKGILDEGLNFISKPVSPSELLRKVREVLNK